jgi:transposase InsO family protein
VTPDPSGSDLAAVTDEVLIVKVRFVAAELARRDKAVGDREPISELCRLVGISRKTYYAWIGRFDPDDVEAFLTTGSRRPRTSPGQVPLEIEDEILRLRKQLDEAGWDNGARSIRYRLERAPADPFAGVVLPWIPSVATINRILVRRGAISPQPHKRPRSATGSFQYDDPNGCWQMDGTSYRLATGRTVMILKIIDDHSRALLMALAASSENLRDTRRCLQLAIDKHGAPAAMLTDRGGALNGDPNKASQFRDLVTSLGIEAISSRGHHPQTCGKNERSHQTMELWLHAQPTARDLPALQELLDRYQGLFNTTRPHQALHGKTPDEQYRSRPKAVAGNPTPARQTSISHVLVSAHGEVASRGHYIGVGRAWAGTRVTVIREGNHITITHRGKLIRSLDLDPSRRYQPNSQANRPAPKCHPCPETPCYLSDET